MNIIHRALLPGSILTLMAGLSACGGGGSSNLAGIGGTGITTIGTITGFGSIFVNGVEYETTGARIVKDGATAATEKSLEVGMVVKVTGTLNPDGSTGTATEVVYNDEIQGPVTDTSSLPSLSQGTFGMLDNTITVSVDANTKWKNVTSPGDLVNAYVEVSGYRTTQGITATYVEKKTTPEESDKAEIKGTLDSNGLTITLVYGNSTLNIDTTSSGCKHPITDLGLTGGSFVELKGTLSGSPIDTICVLSGEEENEHAVDDVSGTVEFEGIVSHLNPGTKTFDLLGHPVNYSQASVSGTLTEGAQVEVHGEFIGGTLIADKVEVED